VSAPTRIAGSPLDQLALETPGETASTGDLVW
jgi:hypothetical protein